MDCTSCVLWLPHGSHRKSLPSPKLRYISFADIGEEAVCGRFLFFVARLGGFEAQVCSHGAVLFFSSCGALLMMLLLLLSLLLS